MRTWAAAAQKLASLDALERLEVRYAPCAAYSARLFAVRLSELLHCKRLRALRLCVPALHDSTDGTVFLSPVFMAQLRACALDELDITLVSDSEGALLLLLARSLASTSPHPCCPDPGTPPCKRCSLQGLAVRADCRRSPVGVTASGHPCPK
jgi:hypothetical protein